MSSWRGRLSPLFTTLGSLLCAQHLPGWGHSMERGGWLHPPVALCCITVITGLSQPWHKAKRTGRVNQHSSRGAPRHPFVSGAQMSWGG